MLWCVLTISFGIGLEIHHGWPFSFHPHLGDGIPTIGKGDLSHSIIELCGEWLGAVILTPAKWLNLRTVPLVVWFGVFSIAWWTISICLWHTLDQWLLSKLGFQPADPSGVDWLSTKLLIARNILVTLPLTKLLTQPLQSMFASTSAIESTSLVGEEAEISSLDATPESGQAKYKTDGSPLLLNVRTDGPHLEKGTKVWLTHYDTKTRVYLVEPISFTSDSDSSQSNGTSI